MNTCPVLPRRTFLQAALTLVGGTVISPFANADDGVKGALMTVKGRIRKEQAGLTLPHEHVMVDFAGAEQVSPDRYNREQVFDKVLPYLKEARELGCQTMMECTPAYLARDPRLLRQLSEASRLHILTNTGYYGARNDQCLPAHAFTETADQLAARWVREYQRGIDGTGIRPGFIKIGVDEGRLSEIDAKLVRAAARTHRRTGLTIAAHTGTAPGAFHQLEILQQEGVSPQAWIWVHAQAEQDLHRHVEAASQGAWVELDGLGWEPVEKYVEMIGNMQAHRLLHRVLVSHDAGWYHVGEPEGGQFQPFNILFNGLLPALRKKGFSEAEIQQLFVGNPAEAFTIRKRLR